MRKHKKNSIIKDKIKTHISYNLKEYCIVTLLFFIGVIIGVILINNSSDEQKYEIGNYIHSFVENLKEYEEVSKESILKESIIENCILAITIWFMGSTVIGVPLVYAIVMFRGFCLSYTIASSIASLGYGQGILFVGASILLQNIIFIPCLFALAVSGIKLYKSIIKDRRKENIKIEIYKHTMFCIIMLILLIISSFIEVYISSFLAIQFAKNIL